MYKALDRAFFTTKRYWDFLLFNRKKNVVGNSLEVSHWGASNEYLEQIFVEK